MPGSPFVRSAALSTPSRPPFSPVRAIARTFSLWKGNALQLVVVTLVIHAPVTILVLAHGPRSADRLRALGRPLVCLSGHTHGGQINLPLVTPLLLRSMREPYVRGRYTLGAVQLYVSRGVGMSGIRVRLNAPAEVTLATLRRAEPA